MYWYHLQLDPWHSLFCPNVQNKSDLKVGLKRVWIFLLSEFPWGVCSSVGSCLMYCNLHVQMCSSFTHLKRWLLRRCFTPPQQRNHIWLTAHLSTVPVVSVEVYFVCYNPSKVLFAFDSDSYANKLKKKKTLKEKFTCDVLLFNRSKAGFILEVVVLKVLHSPKGKPIPQNYWDKEVLMVRLVCWFAPVWCRHHWWGGRRWIILREAPFQWLLNLCCDLARLFTVHGSVLSAIIIFLLNGSQKMGKFIM